MTVQFLVAKWIQFPFSTSFDIRFNLLGLVGIGLCVRVGVVQFKYTINYLAVQESGMGLF